MITRLKVALVILCSTIGLLFGPALIGLAASSNPLDQACNTPETKNSPVCKQAVEQTKSGENPVAGPGGVINTAANIIALVTSVGAIIMILLGGFFYVTAAGNAENAAKAKARITSALIGLVVVALAWALVRLVTDKIIK